MADDVLQRPLDADGQPVVNLPAPTVDSFDAVRNRATDVIDPAIRRILETSGPSILLVGAVAVGQFLRRVAATVIGADVPLLTDLFGDGQDGNVTIAADTTLLRDMYYETLTVDATAGNVTLNPGSFRIFCRTGLVLTAGAGTPRISIDGAAGSGAAPGNGGGFPVPAGPSSGPASDQFSLAHGGIGGTPGGAPSSIVGQGPNGERVIGPAGATTSDGGSGGGEAAIAVFPGYDPSPARCGNLIQAINMYRSTDVGIQRQGGGAGGTAGLGGGKGTTPGFGGGGAGVFVVAARNINNAGIISADGGGGGAATVGPAGGGGGGGGGTGVLVYLTSSGAGVGTVQALGGAGGAGIITAAGAAGVNGKIFAFNLAA